MRVSVGGGAPLVLSILSLLESQATAQSLLFDFDATPYHTPLPLDITVGDVTASFSGTGQSFSIQRANSPGITPVGFAGNALYPNSIYPADLLVSFSLPLQGISIMYAPNELGCDTSATMRITGYTDATPVGTSTATAPTPGTWPTGVLMLSSPQGFNRVVVHYDASPPGGCGQWAPMFMADNMTVTPLPALWIDNVAVVEGDAGTATLGFTVSLSPVSDQTVTVNYATADGTATTTNGDYLAASGILTFAPGVATQPVNVTVNGDVKNEADETLTVTLSGSVNAPIVYGQGTGTITNDDAVPALSINDVAVAEGNAGTATLGFTVSLSAASGQTVSVAYATANGTATTADGDYLAASGTLTFAPGVTTQPVNVTVNGDTKNEADETVLVNLSAPVNATILDGQGNGTITNDDPAMYLLTVSTAGPGSGSVTSSPPGIACGVDCTESYAAGTVVTLTAEPGPSSTFEGWSGGSCSGTSLVCQLTVDTARSVTATFALAASTGTAYYTVSPCRVLDSRLATGPWGGQPLGAQQERTATVVGGTCAIPATAKALSFNLIATGATAGGHIRIYPAGNPRPKASSLNFAAGQTRANNGVVGLGAVGDLAFFSGQASGSVHVILDVSGYFE